MLRELRIQIVRAAIFLLLKLGLLKYVGELFANQVFLLFVKDINFILHIVEPWVEEDLLGGEPLGYALLKHVLHEVAGQLGDCVAILDLLLVQLVCQVANLIGLEGHIAVQDGIEAHTGRPNVDWEAFIADFLNYFWCYIGRSTALFK